MKHLLIAAAVAVAAVATSAFAADVGVSVSIGQPGFYGQIDIGNFPRPQVINTQPVIIERGEVERPPIYLYVPPGHQKHWGKHCRQYNACGERVIFVRDDWYNREYVPRYQEQHRDHQEADLEEDREEHGDDNRKDHRKDHR